MTTDDALINKMYDAYINGLPPNYGNPYWPGLKAALAAARPVIRAEALEEAATECMVQMPQGDDEFTKGYRMACEENARNIRALKEKA